MRVESWLAETNQELLVKVRQRRLETYWKVVRGLEHFPLANRFHVAAAVCRELWNIRWQPLREVN